MTTSISNSTLSIKPSEDLVASTINNTRDEFKNALKKDHISKIVIDLGQVGFIDSSGIGLIAGLSKECKEKRKIPFSVINASDTVKEIFTLVKLEEMLES